MKNFIRTIFTFLFLGITLGTSAQDSKGTDFWIMFNSNAASGNTLTLYITGETNTNGTVDIPGLPFSTNFNVIAGSVTTVNVPIGAQASTAGIDSKGIHVTANDEVTVYGFNAVTASTDAFLCFPSDAIGNEYRVMSYIGLNSTYPSSVGIVAAEAGNTTITITPSIAAGGYAAAVPFNVVLTQGQTFLLEASAGTRDLTGSLITADKNVSVFSGTRCSNVPLGSVYCDHLVEQLPPLSSWGKEFATVPLATRLNGDTYRFMAQNDNTNVLLNGGALVSLDAGEFFETILAGYNSITSNEPIMVAQFSNSTTYDGITSDPFMLLVPPTEQFLTDYTFNSGTANIPINYVNIIAKTTQTGLVLVDGSNVPVGDWNVIAGTAFSGASVAITAGQHKIFSTFPIGVFVYGFGPADSYGYLGGQSFSPVATVSSITLSPTIQTVQQGQQVCVTATVLDQFSNPVVGVNVDFTASGSNSAISFGNTNAAGEISFCYFANNDGSDNIIASIFGLSATATATILESFITLTPTSANILQGDQQCLIATVVDANNNPVDIARVSWVILGPNSIGGWGYTGANGEKQFCYDGNNLGVDNITAWIGQPNSPKSASSVITVTDCNITLSEQITDLSCHADNSGAIDLTMGGTFGTPQDLTFSWTGPNGFVANTEDLSGLEAGSYMVVVSSALGCSETGNYTVGEPDSLTVVYNATPILCNGGLSQESIVVTGGTAPYDVYNQNNGALALNLPEGVVKIGQTFAANYVYTVTDANGCTNVFNADIPEPPALTCQINFPNAIPGGNVATVYPGWSSDIELTAVAGGGTPGYTYSWSDGQSGDVITVSPATTTVYTVTITDDNGCTTSCSVTVNVVDVACGKKNDKVLVCHNGHEICISPNAVSAHLGNHAGDYLGPCSGNKLGSGIDQSFTLYPNPSAGVVSLEFGLQTLTTLNIELYNANGQKVFEKALTESEGNHIEQFDFSQYANGLYMLRIISVNGIETLQFVIQK